MLPIRSHFPKFRTVNTLGRAEYSDMTLCQIILQLWYMCVYIKSINLYPNKKIGRYICIYIHTCVYIWIHNSYMCIHIFHIYTYIWIHISFTDKYIHKDVCEIRLGNVYVFQFLSILLSVLIVHDLSNLMHWDLPSW